MMMARNCSVGAQLLIALAVPNFANATGLKVFAIESFQCYSTVLKVF